MKKQIDQINPNTINPSPPSTQTIPTQKKPTKYLIVLLLILLVATSATSVFFFYQKRELKKQITSLEASLQNCPVVGNTSDPTYDSGVLTNNYLGIQLEYPDTWTTIANHEEPMTNYVASIGTPSNIKIRASNCSFMAIQKLSGYPTATLEAVAQGRRQYVNATDPVKTVAGSTPGYIIEYSEDGRDYQEFIFNSQKQYARITFPKDSFHEETIQEILSTLLLIN